MKALILAVLLAVGCGGFDNTAEVQTSALTPVGHWHASSGSMSFQGVSMSANGAFVLDSPGWRGPNTYRYIRQRASSLYSTGAVDCNLNVLATTQFGSTIFTNTGFGVCHITWNGQNITFTAPAGYFEIYSNGAEPPLPDLHEDWAWFGWSPFPLNMLAYAQ